MNAIGMIETNSIPAGIEAGDAMLKAAAVELVTAQPVCAGKYVVLVAGDVAAVKASVADGEPVAGNYLVDSIVIPNVHEQVIAALSACTEIKETAALGIIETYSIASAVICADAAVKAAEIDLIEIRLGRGLGGKSFITLTGDVAAVKAAVAAAADMGEEHGMVANTVVIPSPHPDLFKAIY
jgi:microcompartment protein CcmL/EutN